MVEVVNSLFGELEAALAERDEADLRRRLTPRDANAAAIDLSNNDYLRLSRHPEVIAAGQAALAQWGASAAASPLISGYTRQHEALEQRLAGWAGFAHGLVWNSGYAANQAVLGRLPKQDDLVLADRLIHQSMIEGVLRSGARLMRYRHLDLEHLEQLLTAHANRRVFVVTESVFSMDGDYPDLAAMAKLKERYDFVWIVDEAHAIGWYGERGSGLAEAAGVSELVDIYVGTLGKGLGSMGAFTLFHQAMLRDYFINFAGEFIYSTYLAPVCAAAAHRAVDVAETMTSQRLAWQERSRRLRHKIASAPMGDSPIIPVTLGPAEATLRAAERLRELGFIVGAVRPPTVPENGSRLRISLNMELTDEELDRLALALREVAS